MPFELNSSDARKLLAHFEGRRGEVLSLVRALCEAESPSGDADGSRAVVSLLSDAARALRPVASVERVAAQNDYGEHLLLRAFTEGATDEARAILLLGHTDTVHPRGTLAERPWRETEGRIYAPGIFDMKANCAVALEALRACDATGLGPRRPVTLLLTCDEESGSFSGRELVEAESRRAECVLVLEPPAPGGRVKTARKGTGLFNLQVEGRAAHAGLEPEKGVSAGINRPPLERTKAVAELFERARRVASAFQFELGEASVGGASDGNFAAAVGATVLDGLGVEGDGAHAAHEHILAERLALRGALLAALVATL